MIPVSQKRPPSWLEMGLAVLPAIILLIPLLALTVAGSSTREWGGRARGGWANFETFEHGWPITFLNRTVQYRTIHERSSRWTIWRGERKKWHLVEAAADVAIFGAVAGFVIALSILRARQNRIWRLTLRESFAALLLISIFAAHFGWCVRRGERDLEIGRRFQGIQGQVGYEYCGPKWLERLQWKWLYALIEDVPLESVSWVSLGTIKDPDIKAACNLLAEVDRPREVIFKSADTTEPLLQLMLESLTKCQPEELSLSGIFLESDLDVPWSPELLEPLTRNPRLRKLNLNNTEIGDAAIVALLRCPQLRGIELYSTAVTAQGVRRLLMLPNLEELTISEEAMSDELQKQADRKDVRINVVQ